MDGYHRNLTQSGIVESPMALKNGILHRIFHFPHGKKNNLELADAVSSSGVTVGATIVTDIEVRKELKVCP